MFLLYRVTARGGWRRRARVMWGYLSDYGWAGTGAGAVYIVCVVVGLWGCHGLGLLGAHLAVLWSVCGAVYVVYHSHVCGVVFLRRAPTIPSPLSSITLTSVGLSINRPSPSPLFVRFSKCSFNARASAPAAACVVCSTWNITFVTVAYAIITFVTFSPYITHVNTCSDIRFLAGG